MARTLAPGPATVRTRPPTAAARGSALVALTVLLVAFALTGCGTGGSSAISSTAPGATADTRSGTTTLAGSVVAAPACPNDRPGTDCPPRPVEDAVVTALLAGQRVASTTTLADGTFALSLPPGTYVVVAKRVTGLVSQARTTVEVPRPAGASALQLTLDSFIR